jgi:septum site-determining protein MinC
MLVGLMRGYSMIPVGVRGGTAAQNEAAQAMELAILGDVFVQRSRPASKPKRSAAREPERGSVASRSSQSSPGPAKAADTKRESEGAGGQVGAVAFKLVTRPVRSGQRVYAAGGDLSVVAAVSSGAELMADGNIHVYGALRGRAMAGMKGDVGARIFCQDLQAELISVAGHYRVSENIPAELKGAPVQIFLDKEVLRIERL